MAELNPNNSAMHRVLAAHRETLNAMFRAHLALHRNLEAEDFFAVLALDLAPIAQAIDEAGGPLDRVFRQFYELALTLTERGLLGPKARLQTVTRCWRELLPRFGYLLGTHPEVAVSLSNAAYHMRVRPDVLDTWLSTMARVAALQPSAAALLKAGQVAVWSSGMAHFRESALDAWLQLDGPLSHVTLRLEPHDETPKNVLRQQLQHPFLTPGSVQNPSLKAIWCVGGFRGFGGSFFHPPMLTAHGNQVFARDRAGTFRIFADVFGATVERAHLPDSTPERPSNATHFAYQPLGRISAFGTSREFPHLVGASSVVGTADFLAVALPHSHQVWIVAWTA